jgi:hypothetical protein
VKTLKKLVLVVERVPIRHNIVSFDYIIKIRGWFKGDAHHKVINHIRLGRSKGETNITMG